MDLTQKFGRSYGVKTGLFSFGGDAMIGFEIEIVSYIHQLNTEK